jgi:class 3 adenylate cyclase/tetratricopeptide (TPR) repeat protein
VCPSCSAENSEGKRFCGDCGQPLTVVCPSCGAEVEPGKRFCGDCGAPVTGATAPDAAPPERARQVAERRQTTVLFGDLVGFTTISESRDAEDVRELLSQYFAMASTVVGRYGGTIEKFIGDAVMAVWGVPVAHEDDAERAVRAGLDLVAEIAVLADKVRVEGLDMRVGILTGEVAVTLGAVGEGMVAGDAVNTAARIQSAAEPGQVLVDDITRSLTSAAVTYTDAGEHSLKGKAEPVRLHRAGAIVAVVGGAQRVDGLEAPFTGRDRELRVVKELFHAAVDERRPRLVALSGLAGVGKTRLAWEFEKYVDGISEEVWWHRSRALSYGDGVSFFPVAEMLRARLGVTDGEPSSIVAAKLDAGIEQFVRDGDEQDRLRPALAVLLGIETSRDDAPSTFIRDELFSAWAGFFEHLSGGDACVVLVFDDMQHADPDLLDFLEFLLDTARHPLFVLSLARPELADGRPGWGTGRRATTLHLEPFGADVMAEIVVGLVHGLPEQACSVLVERSEGIPLYALEMVRALIDRDAVIPRDGRYVLASDADQRVDLTTLDAPPSLQALIAARLDALTPAERRVVQDATVLGLAFSRDGIGAVSDAADLDALLDELVRKEILELHSDRFSAERGQYRFVQALVRTVAYDTLSRRDRKARHLAVAAYLERTSEGDEFAAVIARHQLDALDSGPDDADADELAAVALGSLERAARRAEALGSPDEALRHYTAALAREPSLADRARLCESAARVARSSNRRDEAVTHAEEAQSIYQSLGQPVDAGRAVALLGELLCDQGRHSVACELLVPVYEGLADVPDADAAIMELAHVLSRAFAERNDYESATPYGDRAMELAEANQDWERVSSLLSGRGVAWLFTGRPTGGIALLRGAAELGRRHDVPRASIRPLLNLCAFLKNQDLDGARAAGREAVEVTIQVGARDLLTMAALNLALAYWVSGDWDELERLYAQHQDDFFLYPFDLMLLRATMALVRTARGEPIDFDPLIEVSDDDIPAVFAHIPALATAVAAEVAGRAEDAARAHILSVDLVHELAGIDDDFPIFWPVAVESALAAGDVDGGARLLGYVADVPPVLVSPLARAQWIRLRALVAIARGDGDDVAIDADLARATDAFRAFGAPYYVARTLLERAERASVSGDADAAAPLRQEAEEIFVSLRAERWVAESRAVGSFS